jgi:hypothetical protein
MAGGAENIRKSVLLQLIIGLWQFGLFGRTPKQCLELIFSRHYNLQAMYEGKESFFWID